MDVYRSGFAGDNDNAQTVVKLVADNIGSKATFILNMGPKRLNVFFLGCLNEFRGNCTLPLNSHGNTHIATINDV